MDYKKTKAPHNTVTRDVNALTEEVGNVYETVVILGKRANQIGAALKKELDAKLQDFSIPQDGIEETFENKEQIEISKSRLQWELNFLTENLEIDILFYEDEILGITLPSSVALRITDCEPAVRGDTVNKAMKNAVVETGYRLRVPLFIDNGELISIRTDNGEYDGRA